MGSEIKIVNSREVLTFTGPAVKTKVTTKDGSFGIGVAGAGFSRGKHEISFVYDGGERYGGRGVLEAVKNVNEIIAPSLKGIDVTEQRKIDETMITLDGTNNKSRLGGNAIASVSEATLKAAAKSLSVPLYRYIGGMDACVLPIPTVLALTGSRRYGGGEHAGGKPSYEFVCYGFKTLSEALSAGQEVQNEFENYLKDQFHIRISKFTDVLNPVYESIKKNFARFSPDFVKQLYFSHFMDIHRELIPSGKVESDREIWEALANAIENAGYQDKVGLLVDVAAGHYYDDEQDTFVGLFSKEDKSREDLIDVYENMVATYPFVILEDPLDEDDYEGHAILTKKLDVEIAGDDFFATNITRLKKGIELGACSMVLPRVSQIGTVSEALDVIRLAYENDYKVMPCGGRGEGVEIIDYAVGVGSGYMKGGGSGKFAKRLLEIEEELGSSAKFLGKNGFWLGLNAPYDSVVKDLII